MAKRTSRALPASTDPIRFGIVGLGGRAAGFAPLFDALGGEAAVVATCDTDPTRQSDSARLFGEAEFFTSHTELIASRIADALIITTPMPFHAPMSIDALTAGLHVLSEVPAAVTVEEARRLVQTVARSKATYGMAENYLYTVENRMVRNLAAAGMFGRPYYGVGEYLHELKGLNETTPWRRKWQTGICGITYPTHSVGPLLDWLCNDRVVALTAAGTGSHFSDRRGESYHDDSSTMLCRLASGGLLQVRLDMISDRPHATTNYEFQGTDGVYESGRGGPGEQAKVWLRALDGSPHWRPLAEAYAMVAPGGHETNMPELETVPDGVGHGGGDFFVLRDFVDALKSGRSPATDIHRALDMTLPGLVSQESIRENSSWLPVPDSRDWVEVDSRSGLH